MAKIDDGGPAFPIVGQYVAPGMSLRDYFAGQIIAGMLAQPGMTIDIAGKQFGEGRALTSYALADAMIAARRGQ